MTSVQGYHAHVYFDGSTAASAESLRALLLKALGAYVRVSGLVNFPIGPHPLPMFEVDFLPESFDRVVPWLMRHHGAHSVLVHPLMGDELAEHRDHALWIGKQLPLDFAFLEAYAGRSDR